PMKRLLAPTTRKIAAAVALCWIILPLDATALELQAPKPLPPITLLTMNGEETGLDAHRGDVVVLNFWATWCAPCKREMPSLARLQDEFEGEALQVVALAVDRAGPEKIEQFMSEAEASSLTVYRDPKMASMKDFELRGLPTTLLVDRDGQIVARHDGFAEWDTPEVISSVRTLLEGGS
ncbi:MAG: TlpA disulfide reductase family protein, partial [Geminicoccaceae bacterium]